MSLLWNLQAIDLDLQKLWLIIKQRWLPAVGMFSCVGIAVVVASLPKPVYEAQGKLLFKKTRDFFLYRFRQK